MSITIIKNKEPIYDVEDYDVVLVGVSTHNMLMGNFQSKIGRKYPIVEQVYNKTPYGDVRKLGKRITIEDLTPIVSLMFICTYPSRKENFIDYDSLEHCLRTANAEFKGKRVMTTVLGCTKFDGKGDKRKCLKIIKDCTKDIDLYVYDYEPITIREEYDRQQKYFKNLKDKYKDDNEMLEKIKKLSIEMKKKCFLPLSISKGRSRKRTDDDILNI